MEVDRRKYENSDYTRTENSYFLVVLTYILLFLRLSKFDRIELLFCKKYLKLGHRIGPVRGIR